MTITANTSTPPLELQEPTKRSLKHVLTGRPLNRWPNHTKNYCKRCRDKNHYRQEFGIEKRDEYFEDGERVRMYCSFETDETEDGWVVWNAHHIDHPQKPQADIARPGAVQAQVTARFDRDGWEYVLPFLPGDGSLDTEIVEDAGVLHEVEIEWFSPKGDGEEREPIREPNEHGLIELKHQDPRPGWPKEDNKWRKELLKSHDAWDIETEVAEDPEPL